MTCRYLTCRTLGTDPIGRQVLAYGYPCDQPAVADGACAEHLTAAAGLSPWPLLPQRGRAGPHP